MATKVVLDASAIVALLRSERGADIVESYLDGAAVTTINIAEVGDGFSKRGEPIDDLPVWLDALGLEIIPADLDLALGASSLFITTREAGLSLGDRFCLSLARRLNRVALTADRSWADIAKAAGVEVKLIR